MTLGTISLMIALTGIGALLELLEQDHDKKKETVFEND